MNPAEFIALWKDNKLSERGGAQQHFSDLCDVITVYEPDPELWEEGFERKKP